MSTPDTLTRAGTFRYVMRLLAYRFGVDRVTDLAAAMTYYLVLSVFPLMLATVSIVNLVGGAEWLVPRLEAAVDAVASPAIAQAFAQVVGGFLASEGAGLTLVISLVAALWSASGYIGAFTRAVNTIYQVGEGRNFLKLKAIQLLMTLVLVLLLVLLSVSLAVSSSAARWLGNLVGLPSQFEAVWAWLRYPLMAVVVVILVQMLYFVAPNVRQPRVRVLSIGALVAIVLAVLIVLCFTTYLSVFNGMSSYAKTYGVLAGVIIALFFMFLWNVALLVGAELDAALERLHQLTLGLPAESGLILPPRDERGIKTRAAAHTALVRRGEAIRAEALATGAEASAWYSKERLDAERDESLEPADS